jgi:hypothetical protein
MTGRGADRDPIKKVGAPTKARACVRLLFSTCAGARGRAERPRTQRSAALWLNPQAFPHPAATRLLRLPGATASRTASRIDRSHLPIRPFSRASYCIGWRLENREPPMFAHGRPSDLAPARGGVGTMAASKPEARYARRQGARGERVIPSARQPCGVVGGPSLPAASCVREAACFHMRGSTRARGAPSYGSRRRSVEAPGSGGAPEGRTERQGLVARRRGGRSARSRPPSYRPT